MRLLLGARAVLVASALAAACAPVPRPAASPGSTRSAGRVVFDQRSPFARGLVIDEGPERVMRFDALDGSDQSAIVRDRPGALPIEYVRLALLGLAHHGRATRVLMVGLGGGTFTTLLHRAEPDMRIDAVEIDPVVVAAARACFGLREDDRYRVHVADAADFMAKGENLYDYVLLDSYAGEEIPRALRSEAFFRDVRRRLAPDGVVAINIAELEAEGAEVARAFRTVLRPFDCRQAPRDGNVILFAAAGPRPPPGPAFWRWLRAWDARKITDFSLEALAAHTGGPDCARALGQGR